MLQLVSRHQDNHQATELKFDLFSANDKQKSFVPKKKIRILVFETFKNRKPDFLNSNTCQYSRLHGTFEHCPLQFQTPNSNDVKGVSFFKNLHNPIYTSCFYHVHIKQVNIGADTIKLVNVTTSFFTHSVTSVQSIRGPILRISTLLHYVLVYKVVLCCVS